MFSFPPMKRWHGFALLLLTIQVPAFAEGIDLLNTRSFHGGPINNETVGQLTVKWVYQTVPDTGTANSAQGSVSSRHQQKPRRSGVLCIYDSNRSMHLESFRRRYGFLR